MLIVAIKMLFFDKKSIEKESSAISSSSEKKG